MADTPSYIASGEAALARVIDRFLAKYPDEADHFRLYFTEKAEILGKLSWAVAKRAGTPGQTFEEVARQAVTALRSALSKASPEEAQDFADWFSLNDSYLMALAKGIARDLAQEAPPTRPEIAALVEGDVKPKRPGGSRENALRYDPTPNMADLSEPEPATEAAGELPPLSPSTPASTEALPLEEASPAARTEANVRAILFLASGVPTSEPHGQETLRGYSGWGGLSIDAVASRLPPEWLPELQGLANEYYTPRRLCAEVARVVRSMLPSGEGPIQALEPSAGIGRFLEPMTGPGWERVRWTAVEFSAVSARLLSSLYPDITVFSGPFEQFVADREAEVAGTLQLVVSNPPYGKRGGTARLDPDLSYREDKAYIYFLRRALDLLAAGGVGVFLIPYGFLSSKLPQFREQRARVLRRHHLSVAFRLPSELFPGANIVTDLLFFQARGGELPEPLPEDAAIVDGRYFEETPGHILGQVIGQSEEAA